MHLKICPIGYVENNIGKQSDENWGSVVSSIRLKDDYIGGLSGLEDFSHVMILTYLHEAQFVKEKHLKRHPRNSADMPLLGIFSQRGKDRPNPIGVTTVRIIEVLEDTLLVEGLDAINGTPVIDIKPYYPQYDKVDNANVPEWVERLMKKYF